MKIFFLISGKWSDALFPENNAWLFADFSFIFNQRLEVRKERYNFRSITADSDCQIDFTLICVATISILMDQNIVIKH